MYEEVIRIIHGDMMIKQEDAVMTAIQKLDIDVNKEELIKALQYDRAQYEKGYADGAEQLYKFREDNNRLRKENEMLWKKHKPVAVVNERCPVCGTMTFVQDKAYCRCCGQLLKFVGARSPEADRPGGRSLQIPDDDTEIGMITNINDRI